MFGEETWGCGKGYWEKRKPPSCYVGVKNELKKGDGGGGSKLVVMCQEWW